uniref:Serine/threonine-protein phosphatase 7 long form homolog n=1 Tax=Nicotiana tabacum TaxID=4097 RepID=A0A1S4D5A6_TOBAC|nr:PREDICTED: serine/threonine-protein phosphatase 7 long form homolog [Nicotiana tabacum]
MDATIHPGPQTLDLLALQPQHKSEYIWDGQLLTQTFRARRVDLLWEFLSPPRVLHPRMVHYLEEMGLYRIIWIGRIQLDYALITALIERFTACNHEILFETYWDMLHMLTGFMLEDEAVVSGSSRIQLVPIRDHLVQIHHTITDESAEVDVQQYTRLLLLLLFGGVLFPNTSGNLVSLSFLHHIDRFEDIAIYSWGGAVISYLYRQMCRACIGTQRVIGGFLPLLQFIWTPYNDEFGLPQPIPTPPTWHALHYKRDDRSRADNTFMAWLNEQLGTWDRRGDLTPPP